jgi:hypothetical protein
MAIFENVGDGTFGDRRLEVSRRLLFHANPSVLFVMIGKRAITGKVERCAWNDRSVRQVRR